MRTGSGCRCGRDHDPGDDGTVSRQPSAQPTDGVAGVPALTAVPAERLTAEPVSGDPTTGEPRA
jgi:hypothetical protein